jgi:hypothetical protein
MDNVKLSAILKFKDTILVKAAGDAKAFVFNVADDSLYEFSGEVAKMVMILAKTSGSGEGLSPEEVRLRLVKMSPAFAKSKTQAESLREAVEKMGALGFLDGDA